MKLSRGRLHVSQHNPGRLILGAITILLMFGLFFYIGQGYQSYQLDRYSLERDTLLSQLEELKSRNRNLVKENAQLQGISNIERDAYEKANQTLIKLQQEILAQKEQLAFYEGIVSPKKADFGVNLQSFLVKPRNSQNQFSYKLILTKSGKSNKKIQGKIKALVRGEGAEGMSELNFTELHLENPVKDTKFAFRYFQVFQGNVEIPDGFSPLEIEISINPSSKKVKSFTETISWAQLLSEAS